MTKARLSLVTVLVFLLSLELPIVPAQEQVAVAEGNDTQPIGDLEIGDKVVDYSWEWERHTGVGYDGNPASAVTRPVTWIVGKFLTFDRFQQRKLLIFVEI